VQTRQFTQWIREQTDRDDAVGALARASAWWPPGRPRLDDLHEFVAGLVAEGRDPRLHQALDDARCEWRCERWPELFGCDRAA
jgi:hypothetical protein